MCLQLLESGAQRVGHREQGGEQQRQHHAGGDAERDQVAFERLALHGSFSSCQLEKAWNSPFLITVGQTAVPKLCRSGERASFLPRPRSNSLPLSAALTNDSRVGSGPAARSTSTKPR